MALYRPCDILHPHFSFGSQEIGKRYHVPESQIMRDTTHIMKEWESLEDVFLVLTQAVHKSKLGGKMAKCLKYAMLNRLEKLMTPDGCIRCKGSTE